jgi:hypothetical protein
VNDLLASEWERCRHYIEAAIDNSPHLETIEDVEKLLEEGMYMLWTGLNSAVVVEIRNYPTKKILAVVHGGGDKNEIMDQLGPLIEDFAVKNGCQAIASFGREGWKREGERRGWHLGYVCMFKNLKH